VCRALRGKWSQNKKSKEKKKKSEISQTKIYNATATTVDVKQKRAEKVF
jgi:hypothetical protein